jgi:hypothetical protein
MFVAFVTAAGAVGTLLDSLLGAVLWKNAVDARANKTAEGPNGSMVCSPILLLQKCPETYEGDRSLLGLHRHTLRP